MSDEFEPKMKAISLLPSTSMMVVRVLMRESGPIRMEDLGEIQWDFSGKRLRTMKFEDFDKKF